MFLAPNLLLLDGFDSAYSGSEDHAASLSVLFIKGKAAVFDSLDGRTQRILCVKVHLSGFRRVDIRIDLKPFNLAGKLYLLCRGVVPGDRSDPASSIPDAAYNLLR